MPSIRLFVLSFLPRIRCGRFFEQRLVWALYRYSHTRFSELFITFLSIYSRMGSASLHGIGHSVFLSFSQFKFLCASLSRIFLLNLSNYLTVTERFIRHTISLLDNLFLKAIICPFSKLFNTMPLGIAKFGIFENCANTTNFSITIYLVIFYELV